MVEERASLSQGGRQHVSVEGQAGKSLIVGIKSDGIHPKKMFFEVAIRIIGGRGTDQVQNLHCISLRHALDHIVKLSLAGRNTLQTELGLRLHEPLLDVVRPEGRQLNSISVEKV